MLLQKLLYHLCALSWAEKCIQAEINSLPRPRNEPDWHAYWILIRPTYVLLWHNSLDYNNRLEYVGVFIWGLYIWITNAIYSSQNQPTYISICPFSSIFAKQNWNFARLSCLQSHFFLHIDVTAKFYNSFFP